MSASWTGASAPVQASRIRRVLAPVLRTDAVPAAGPRVLLELCGQSLGGRGERGQLIKCADGEAAPVAVRFEERELCRIDEVR